MKVRSLTSLFPTFSVLSSAHTQIEMRLKKGDDVVGGQVARDYLVEQRLRLLFEVISCRAAVCRWHWMNKVNLLLVQTKRPTDEYTLPFKVNIF